VLRDNATPFVRKSKTHIVEYPTYFTYPYRIVRTCASLIANFDQDPTHTHCR
jgi:hypothetical protein